jgi:hypothetical protein
MPLDTCLVGVAVISRQRHEPAQSWLDRARTTVAPLGPGGTRALLAWVRHQVQHVPLYMPQASTPDHAQNRQLEARGTIAKRLVQPRARHG